MLFFFLSATPLAPGRRTHQGTALPSASGPLGGTGSSPPRPACGGFRAGSVPLPSSCSCSYALGGECGATGPRRRQRWGLFCSDHAWATLA